MCKAAYILPLSLKPLTPHIGVDTQPKTHLLSGAFFFLLQHFVEALKPSQLFKIFLIADYGHISQAVPGVSEIGKA